METLNKLNEVGSGVDEKCSCKRGKWTVVMLVLFLLAGIACWYIHHPNRPRAIHPEIDLKPGTICIVQFRRDMLGGSMLVAPLTNKQNGVGVSLRGMLIAINNEAILLEITDEHYTINDVPQQYRLWIPRNNILLIAYDKPKNQ